MTVSASINSELKLRIYNKKKVEMESDEQPKFLSASLVSGIAKNIGQKSGVFQLLSFVETKDSTFSVKISDGSFEVRAWF